MVIFKLLVLLLELVLSGSLEHIYYVKPNSLSSSCPGQPCLTLDMYTTQNSKYFANRSIFLFLAGNHSVHTAIHLKNISDIILRGKRNDSDVTVLCKTEVALCCENVSNLTIQGVTFAACDIGENLSALSIINSNKILFLNLKFQGSSDLSTI